MVGQTELVQNWLCCTVKLLRVPNWFEFVIPPNLHVRDFDLDGCGVTVLIRAAERYWLIFAFEVFTCECEQPFSSYLRLTSESH